MRTNLKVPFAEKDEVKKLGARWDAARKIWYVESDGDMTPFARWAPTPHERSVTGELPQKAAPAGKRKVTGSVIAGSDYIEQARVCECLPWDVCDKCQSTALNHSPAHGDE